MKRYIFLSLLPLLCINNTFAQDFQGRASYFSKTKMELGNWGARMSEAQKNQIKERLKDRLEKTYVLKFNTTESVFTEDEKIDAISGATDSWGANFSRGEQYKDVENNTLVQTQEFYGKRFLVKDQLQPFEWNMESEVREIGGYTCFKATAVVPSTELSWFNFSWEDMTNNAASTAEADVRLTQIEAWYTLQIPVKHGPAEFWGLPGLILEVSADNTTMLCYEILINPKQRETIEPPQKGLVITKSDYRATMVEKMTEMRNSYGGRRRN
ncbi:MAG: GLPGLI family protein [Flavobacteriia bacterium]|nr:GLPGLI family protein [Flavobacteriia bacterium]